MAQHDYIVDDGSGLAVRTDMNAVLAAIVSNNSGAGEPSPTYAGMWWLDTSIPEGPGVLKLRNKANNGWITLPTAGEYLPVTGGTILGDLAVIGDFANPEYDRVVGSHAGTTEPSLPVPGMLWFDTSTTPATMKIRNLANTGWVPASPTDNPTFTTQVTVTHPTGAAQVNLISQGESRKIYGDPGNNWTAFTNPAGSGVALISDTGDLWTAQNGWLKDLLLAKQANLGFTPVRQTGVPVITLTYSGGHLYVNADSTGLGYIFTSGDPPPVPPQKQWSRGDVGSVTYANKGSGSWPGNSDQAGSGLRYGWDGDHGSEVLPGTWRNLGGGGNGDLNYVAQRRA